MSNITCINRVAILLLVLCLKFCHGNINVADDNHGTELTQSINLARQEYVQKMCDMYFPGEQLSVRNLTAKDLDHILVDHEHKLLYCYVPKVACTNWKRVLLHLMGRLNSTDPMSISAKLAHSPGMFENLSSIQKPNERLNIVERYTKFVMVRHPFERLLSAYRNKLQGDSESARYFQHRIGRYIVRNFRKNPSKESLSRGHDVTFREFSEYIVAIEEKNSRQDKSQDKKILDRLFGKKYTTTVEIDRKYSKTNMNRKKDENNVSLRPELVTKSLKGEITKEDKNEQSSPGINMNNMTKDQTSIDYKNISHNDNNLVNETTNLLKNNVDIVNKYSGYNIKDTVRSNEILVNSGVLNNNREKTSMTSETSTNNYNDIKISVSMLDDSSTAKSPVGSGADNKMSKLELAEIFNEHWTPAYSLCHPCALKYNVIGKYETLQEDSRLLLSQINPSGLVRFPTARQQSQATTASRLAQELKTLPVDLLQRLYRVYEMDFRVFDYGLESLLGFELA